MVHDKQDLSPRPDRVREGHNNISIHHINEESAESSYVIYIVEIVDVNTSRHEPAKCEQQRLGLNSIYSILFRARVCTYRDTR